jgi:hypothetical protein
MVRTAEGRGAATGPGRRVAYDEGDFDAACDVCGIRPTAVAARVWDENPEVLQKAGELGLVEHHHFCAEHEGAADALYHELRRS